MTYAEIFSAVVAVLVAVAAFAVAASIVVLAATLIVSGYVSDVSCEALAKLRRAATPACSSCRWCEGGGFGVPDCACPAYLDRMERLECRRHARVPAPFVRGTRWCRWEERHETAGEPGAAPEEEGI